MVRVLLAVAHSSLRATLEECLMQGGEMSCDTAATPEELWRRLSQNTWDVLILDLRLPDQPKRATSTRCINAIPISPSWFFR